MSDMREAVALAIYCDDMDVPGDTYSVGEIGVDDYYANADAAIAAVLEYLIAEAESESDKPNAPHWMGYVPDWLRSKVVQP